MWLQARIEGVQRGVFTAVVLTQTETQTPKPLARSPKKHPERTSFHPQPTEVVWANCHICKAGSSRHRSSAACAAGNALWERVVQGSCSPTQEPAGKGLSVFILFKAGTNLHA